MVIRISDKKHNYNNVTKLLVKPKINPSKQCKHFCARNKINECINILCRIKKYAPEFIDYLGWPIDYDNDIEWM